MSAIRCDKHGTHASASVCEHVSNAMRESRFDVGELRPVTARHEAEEFGTTWLCATCAERHGVPAEGKVFAGEQELDQLFEELDPHPICAACFDEWCMPPAAEDASTTEATPAADADPAANPAAANPAATSPAAATIEGAPPPSTRQLWFEVAAVICIGVLPDLWACLLGFLFPEEYDQSLASHRVWVIGRSIFASVPVLYLIWRSGEGWQKFGLVRLQLGKDLFLAFLVLFVWHVGSTIVHTVFNALAPDAATSSPADADPAAAETMTAALWGLDIFANLLNGFSEELIMRAYLLIRLRELLGTAFKAIVVTSILFGSYHLYQGPWSAMFVVFDGVFLALVFLWLKRLWPLALAHAGYNLLIAVAHELL